MENGRIWNLTWWTNVKASDDEGETNCLSSYLFTDFEEAKDETLKVIGAYAHSKNGLFDGNGGIVGFGEYFKRLTDEDIMCGSFEDWDPEDIDFDFLEEENGEEHDPGKVRDFPESLRRSILSGFRERPGDLYWTDYLLEINSNPYTLKVRGIDDGPCNGVDPFIFTNMFDMSDPESDYSFIAENAFSDFDFEEEKRKFHLSLFSMIPDSESVDMEK